MTAHPYTILDTRIHAITQEELLGLIASAVTDERHIIAANHNLHSLYLYHRDPMLRTFYQNAHIIFADGMSVILIGRLQGVPLRKEHRITCIDYIRPLMAKAASQRWRVFFLGGRPGICKKAGIVLKQSYPDLIMDCHHGFFDTKGEENTRIVRHINAFSPHILLVGMGMPRQEHWILQNHDKIKANVILNIGACMDFVAGALPTPPRWLGPLGLEWAFRLVTEPGRLWRRYLVEPWFVLGLLIKEMFQQKELP